MVLAKSFSIIFREGRSIGMPKFIRWLENAISTWFQALLGRPFQGKLIEGYPFHSRSNIFARGHWQGSEILSIVSFAATTCTSLQLTLHVFNLWVLSVNKISLHSRKLREKRNNKLQFVGTLMIHAIWIKLERICISSWLFYCDLFTEFKLILLGSKLFLQPLHYSSALWLELLPHLWVTEEQR